MRSMGSRQCGLARGGQGRKAHSSDFVEKDAMKPQTARFAIFAATLLIGADVLLSFASDSKIRSHTYFLNQCI